MDLQMFFNVFEFGNFIHVPLTVLENVISRLLFISPKFDLAILTADDFYNILYL